MRLAQIVLDSATAFDRRMRQLDVAALAGVVTFVEDVGGADLAHVYGRIARAHLRDIPVPYVASSAPPRGRLALRRTPSPSALISPLKEDASGAVYVPEAVDDAYFEAGDARPAELASRTPRVIGSIARASTAAMVEQTMSRIDRFRDDVVWQLYDSAPPAVDLAALDAWIDPASEDSDMDGLVAEAVAACVPTVATRTQINGQRLDRGYAGLLVPADDPNEMTHAILAALFKPEVARAKSDAARQTRSKFRVRHRARILAQLYGTLTG